MVGGADDVGQAARLASQITAVVYSFNEADLLPDCLSRLNDFAEIVVCDMQSTDDTVAIAKSHSARVIGVPVVPIAEQVRQLGLDAAETEWVLFVDADEHVPARLYECLTAFVTERPELAGVRLRYDNVAFGVTLAHTLQGSAKYALMRPAAARYVSDGRAHMQPVFNGPVADAPESVPPILHLNFRSVPQSMEKMLRYARSDPRDGNLWANPLSLPRIFLRDVIFSGAWRDGRAGVVLVTLNTIGRLYAAALDWERKGYPDPGWSPRTRRRLTALTETQWRVIRSRDALKRTIGRRSR